jgi:hypothetical protein
MKKTLIMIIGIALFAIGCGRSIPRDKHGNPIFNSRPVFSFDLTNCSVDVHYYTITNNIADRGSVFFVADKPTAEQVMRFATETPAFFFIIHSNHVVRALITLEQHPREDRKQRYAFRIIRDPKKPSNLVPLAYVQDIPDLRAYEIKYGPWDPKSELVKNGRESTLIFNGRTYSMLPLPVLMETLEEVIRVRELYREID